MTWPGHNCACMSSSAQKSKYVFVSMISSPGGREPLVFYVKRGWCLASALAHPSLITQGRLVYETSILSTCISSISMGPAEEKRKHISVNIWLHRGEPLYTAVTAPTVASHRAKWKHNKVSLPTHKQPDTQVLEVNRTEAFHTFFSLDLKAFPFVKRQSRQV